MKTEQSAEETVGELPLSLPLKLLMKRRCRKMKLLMTEKASEEIAAAEVDKVAEVYKVAEETRLKLIKSEGGGGQS